MKSPGRPTKFNEQTIAHLCVAIGEGLSIKSACTVAQIGVTTLAEWRAEHPGLEERLSESRELARQKALRAIQAAGERDWRAWAEWLKLAFSADYRGATKIDVTASAQVSTAVVMTEERRLELIARLKSIRESEQKSLT